MLTILILGVYSLYAGVHLGKLFTGRQTNKTAAVLISWLMMVTIYIVVTIIVI